HKCWLYTRICRVQKESGQYGYTITQQVGNYQGCIFTPGNDYYPEKVCPWLFPVWSLKSGEHYGRGIVEDHAGDFARLSMLSESSALYMQEALRVFWKLTGSGGNVDDIERAETGQVIPLQSGTALEAAEAGDYNKVQQARDEINQIVQRLAQAFMYTGEFRDSERTTATEVQQVATSAERGLGGPYSMQAKTLQIPLAYVLLAEIDEGTVPDIVGNILSLQVVAGLDALGRS
ncbi:portal protein, partial [Cutibacterium acnes]